MPRKGFRKVAPEVSFPELEEAILGYWREHDIVAKGLSRNRGAKEWVFYEGPPTANNEPGVHHVEPRVFKDLYPRFQTMRGHYVHRKAGWDCHGLPVEVEVEKELGLKSKREIEQYGIEKFGERCRESVRRYAVAFERLTDRIGFWINTAEAYWTMDDYYVDSVWWSLKRLHEEGLLFEDYRSAPYCPRCETPLSDHELGQPDVYQPVSDLTVYVRFPLVDDEADLLVWTTTPWTLPSNLAAAIHPDVTYAKVATDGRPVIVAQELVEKVIGEDARILQTFRAADLEGRQYEPPFRFVEPGRPAWFVIPEEFVTVSDGTGVVHVAPAFGAEDLDAGKRHGLPMVNLVDPTGHFLPEAVPYAGLGVREADFEIIRDLAEAHILFREEIYEHNYPHCWRCKTPLIYYAKSSWYIRTTSRKQELLDQNEKTSWFPETIKQGRYGEWLRNNVDWALSRDRYWGTPLPIWRCENAHDIVVGSRSELGGLAGRDLSNLDPHRPFVDEVIFPCRQCGTTSTRVPSVIDAWYDSGCMPFAQWGYPHRNRDLFDRWFPADFIAEALDQTRGWFYSLMACATLLFGENSYRNVLCLGLLVDAEGRKMSKSLGNVVDPWTIIDSFGADALRWWMFASGSPWVNRRIVQEAIEDYVKRYFLTLWNTYSFFVTYANIDGFDPEDRAPAKSPARPELDRWILAELNETIGEATAALESYDALRATRRIDEFVDDLSNWYVRRSRRRFWRSGSDSDKLSAYRTLHECLVKLATITAPFTPFISEEIYTNLTGEESVHLTSWPEPDEAMIDEELLTRMRTARKIVSLGRSARGEAGIKTRQPLAKAMVVMATGSGGGVEAMSELITEELNVKKLEFVGSLENLVDYSAKANFRTLGPRLGEKVKAVAGAIESADALELSRKLGDVGSVTLEVEGEQISLSSEDIEIRARGREGYAVAHDGPFGVALDLDVSRELRLEGLAREVVRAVQEARKQAGLDIPDRITLHLGAAGELEEAVGQHRDWILREVLADGLADSPPGGFEARVTIDGSVLLINLVRKN